MKLLIMFPSTIRGGAEEYALTIASAAAKKGWEVHAAFPKTQETASLILDIEKSGVHYYALNISGSYVQGLKKVGEYLPQLARTIALLLKIKPDTIHLTLPYPDQCLGPLLACGFLRIPTAAVF